MYDNMVGHQCQLGLAPSGPKRYYGPVTSSTTKRGFSAEARGTELNRALRARRILWAYCSHHDGGYYFFDVKIHLRHKDDPDMRQVKALCMLCGKNSIFFVGADELEEHRYGPVQLCQCGLPYDHKSPTREFLQQYNAAPVVCRPNPNGRTDLQ